jgi:hypothetical protein
MIPINTTCKYGTKVTAAVPNFRMELFQVPADGVGIGGAKTPRLPSNLPAPMPAMGKIVRDKQARQRSFHRLCRGELTRPVQCLVDDGKHRGLERLGILPLLPRNCFRLIAILSRSGALASNSACKTAFANSIARLTPRSVRTSTISY